MNDDTLPPVDCTSWCRDGKGHIDAIKRVDQACMSEKHIIELSTEPLLSMSDGTTERQSVSVSLLRERGSRSTTLELSINDWPEVSLTTDEALGLRGILTDLVLTAVT